MRRKDRKRFESQDFVSPEKITKLLNRMSITVGIYKFRRDSAAEYIKGKRKKTEITMALVAGVGNTLGKTLYRAELEHRLSCPSFGPCRMLVGKAIDAELNEFAFDVIITLRILSTRCIETVIAAGYHINSLNNSSNNI